MLPASPISPLLPVPNSPAYRRYGEMMHGVLRFTVQSSVAVVAAELWVLASDGLLRRVPGGIYVDPQYVPPSTPSADACLAALTDSEDTPATAVGVGVAGALWSASTDLNGESLHWHSLDALASNPELPQDKRTADYARAFGLCCGLPFEAAASSKMGILLCFARSTADRDSLVSPANTRFLKSCGTACASVVAADAASAALDKSPASKKVKTLRMLVKSGLLSAHAASRKQPATDFVTGACLGCDQCRAAMTAWAHKALGTGAPALAPASWSQVAFAFLATAATSLVSREPLVLC